MSSKPSEADLAAARRLLAPDEELRFKALVQEVIETGGRLGKHVTVKVEPMMQWNTPTAPTNAVKPDSKKPKRVKIGNMIMEQTAQGWSEERIQRWVNDQERKQAQVQRAP